MPAEADLTGSEIFRTTQWSRVVGAGGRDAELRRECLEWLIGRYWKPVYAYLRRIRGLDRTEAEDLTQEFFAFAMERNVVGKARRDVAKFRTFLKAVLKNFVVDRHRRDGRIKRGGGRKAVPLDITDADETWLGGARMEPEEAMDRMWARLVLERAVRRLRELTVVEGREEDWKLFEAYMGRGGDAPPATYKEVAALFGLSEWNVWKRLTRTLERLKALMREEIAETVRTPAEVDEEFAAISELLR